MEKIRVLIITIDEYYYVPKYLNGILSEDSIEVVGITGVPPSLGTRSSGEFLRDIFQRLGVRIFWNQFSFQTKYLLADVYNRFREGGTPYSPKAIAQQNTIEYQHCNDVNSDSYLEYVESLAPDVILSVAATQRFDPDLYTLADECAINIHSSLLPEYRGLFPSFWMLLNDEQQTGVSIHYIDDEFDSGDLLVQKQYPIEEDDTVHSLNTKAAEAGSPLLVEALEQIRTDSVDPSPLNTDDGSYYSLPSRDDVRRFTETGNEFY